MHIIAAEKTEQPFFRKRYTKKVHKTDGKNNITAKNIFSKYKYASIFSAPNDNENLKKRRTDNTPFSSPYIFPIKYPSIPKFIKINMTGKKSANSNEAAVFAAKAYMLLYVKK